MSGTMEAGRAAGEIRILPYDRRYEADLVEICWKTGLMGRSLEGQGRFEDKRLFAMIFALPFAAFQPELCRLAVAGDGEDSRAVGYLLGTSDSRAEGRFFDRRFAPAIALRLFLYDWWCHPESFKQVMRFLKSERAMRKARPAPGASLDPDELGGPACPAQLHINLHPDWQGLGLGSRLMASYLAALRERGLPAVFLDTSSMNEKALPFYEKLGFKLVASAKGELWAGLPALTLSYVLRLSEPLSS